MADAEGLGPAIPRRRFGAELKRLREERGQTLAEVAAELLISTSKLSRLEKGHAAPQDRDVRDLLNYYDQSDTELGDRMRRWAQEARAAPWWQEQVEGTLPVPEQYMQYETAAALIRGFADHFVPTLLQTEGYARGLVRALESDDPAEIEALVELRLRRQEVITRNDYPVSLDVVLDESVFHRMVGPREVMREQIDSLAASTDLPNVTLRVFPFAAGPHPAVSEGTFSLFHFRRAIDPDIVNIENKFFIEQAARVEVYRKLLDDLADVAFRPDESAEFIRRMATGY
jgi:transcriptional regulator with XRE-family HTH domain